MKRFRGRVGAALLVWAFLAAACGGPRATPAPGPTQAPTEAATAAVPSVTPAPATPTAPATITPPRTPLPAATRTPAPTMTATPPPTATASPAPEPTRTAVPTATVTRRPVATLQATATRAASQPVQLLAELQTGADDLAFSPDGKLLAVGSADYETDTPRYAVEVWDLATWRLRWTGAQAEWLREVAFSPDGARLGSAAFDGTARLWDVATGQVVAQKDYRYWVYGLDFSPGGHWWATGSFDGNVTVADAGSGQTVMAFKNDLMVIDLALAPAGPWVAVLTSGSYGPMRVIVRDIRTFEERVLIDANGVATGDVVFSPDTKWLAAPLGYGNQIVIWQTGVWTEAARLDILQGSVNRLIVSPNGQRLAALIRGGEMNNRIVIWDTATWRVVSQFTLADVGWDIAFSPDGRWVVAGLGQGVEHTASLEAQLWDASAGRLAARMPHTGQVLAVAFSTDGRLIATGSHGSVKVWELRPGE